MISGSKNKKSAFVSKKISKLLHEEGVGRDQAIAMALSMAGESNMKPKQKRGRKKKKPLASF